MFALPQSAPWCFSAHAAQRRCRWHWRQDHVTSGRLRCPEQCKYPYVPLRHWIRGNSNIKDVKIISSPKAMIPLVGSWILAPPSTSQGHLRIHAKKAAWTNLVWICFVCLKNKIYKNPPKWCTYSADMAGATLNCSRLGAFRLHHTTMHHILHAKRHT